MKTSEEILLEEVKDQYNRQLSNWTELNRKSQNFLQINGILLSVVFIGISFIMELASQYLIILTVSTISIILSLIISIFSIFKTSIKETNIEIDRDADLENNEKKIIFGLIRIYKITIDEVTNKNNKRTDVLVYASMSLMLGLFFLFIFILLITLVHYNITI